MLSVETTFADFEESRLQFVKDLSKFIESTDCVEVFQAGQTIILLKPLLNDPNTDISIQASKTLLRLIESSEELSTEVVQADIIPEVIQQLQEGDV